MEVTVAVEIVVLVLVFLVMVVRMVKVILVVVLMVVIGEAAAEIERVVHTNAKTPILTAKN